MIIHDYECQDCGHVEEQFVESDSIPDHYQCSVCGGVSNKIVSMRSTTPIDAAWISDVLEVVDKESTESYNVEFLRHPTRANYKNWMEGNNLRPIDDNEVMNAPKTFDHEHHKKLMLDSFRKRNTITVKENVAVSP